MSQTLELKAAGLFTHPNRLRLPPGALTRAENAVISRPGIVSRRRGFKRSAALAAPASVVSEYLGKLLVLDGTTLKHADPVTDLAAWTSIPGARTPPTGTRMHFLESNGNLYFTTNAGLYTIDSLTATPLRSGTPAGLDTQLSLVGTGASWFLPDSQVGYRHTWTHKDANKNSKQGAPSSQEVLANAYRSATWARAGTVGTFTLTAHGFAVSDVVEIKSSSDQTALPDGSYTVQTAADANTFTLTVPNAGGTSGTTNVGKAFNVSLTLTVPAEIIAGDILEIWRTDLSATDDDAPGDDHRLILTHETVAADVSAGTITLTDNKDPAFFGANLYTNQGLEGLAQANARPPLAKFVVQYEDHTFYFDASQAGTVSLQLLDTAGLVADTSAITFTLAGTTYTFTFSTAENQGARKFKLFTGGLLAEDLEDTVKSLIKIINRDATAPFTARYFDGDDDPPGKLLLEISSLGTGDLTLTASSAGVGDNFDPVLPTSGTSVASTNNAKTNGAWRSKAGQPEAVPVLNTHLFGKANKALLNVVALKEAILVFKEDGLFVLTGQSDGSGGFAFDVDKLDPTVILTVANSLVLLDSAAFSFTRQGALRAGPGAPSVVSRPQVETDLLRLAELSNFASLTHGIAYESDRKYLLWMPEKTTDDTVTIAYVYDYGTNTWALWRKPVAAGHVLSADDRLYLAHAVDPYILIERKSFSATGADYIDEGIPVTVSTVSTIVNSDGETVSLVTLTYSYSGADLAPGFLFEQGSKRSVIDAVTDNGGNSFTVQLRNNLTGLSAGAATIALAIDTIIEWAPVTAGNPASLKQFPYTQLYLEENGGTHQLSFHADTQSAFEDIDEIRIRKTVGWGLSDWGAAPWGDSDPGMSTPLRTMVPRDHQKCRHLSVRYRSRVARHPVDILGLSLDVRPIGTRTERTPVNET